MKMKIAGALVLSFGMMAASQAAVLVTPTDVTTSTTGDLAAVGNIINNTGIDDSNDDPIVPTIANYATTHHISGYAGISWVTDSVGSGDYFDAKSDPVLVFNLGASYDLTDFVYWGYESGGTRNEASAATLEFSTDGLNYSGSISFDGTGTPVGTGNPLTLSLQNTISAQYVRMTITDNQGYSGGGGDRVAIGEVKFLAVPEPSSAALLGLGGLVLILRRRK
jgi:hypothetical protein